MKPIDLSFLSTYPGVIVKGEIFDSKAPIVLSEDLLEIELPSGRIIDVGWYPEHDPEGAYRILLYRGHTGFPLDERHATEIAEVVDAISSLIGQDPGRDSYEMSASSVKSEVVCYG